MSSRGPAQAVARMMVFVMLAASGAAFIVSLSGDQATATQICGIGIGAAVLVALAGTIFVAIAKRSME